MRHIRSFLLGGAVLLWGLAGAAMALEKTYEEIVEEGLAEAHIAFDNRDYALALDLLLPLGEAGNAEAQTIVGEMFRTGLLGMPDFNEAAAWFEAAADQDYPDALFNLGLMYFQHETAPFGIEVTDHNLRMAAFEQFSRAGARGHIQAQLYLGHMHAEGVGVPRDRVEAYKWYQIAAWQRSSLAAAARDRLAADMTADQLDEAKRRARSFEAVSADVSGD
ncbi:MAG: hypothetical protein QGF53_14935 [Alphaproteobacteria bacterium]|jgi:hypothetical protein|nr:hypothetical protein [Alphaproteobacteria bacterium]